MTPQAEAIFRLVVRTIDPELGAELAFLANYGRPKKAIQEIVDLSDQPIDRFVQICLQNNGWPSAKRASSVSFLSNEEFARRKRGG